MILHSDNRIIALLIAGIILANGLLTPMAQAAEKKDKAARHMQQMMQKMQQEKAELQAQFDQEKAALEEKAKKSEEDLGAIKGNLASSNRKTKALAAELETVRKEKADVEANLSQSQSMLETTGKNLEDMTRQYQSAQQDIKDGDTQRKELLANLSKKGQQVIACEAKNAKLHAFGQELVKIYDHPEALRGEPFTQLKRVELENILQDYRDKLDEQRINMSGQ